MYLKKYSSNYLLYILPIILVFIVITQIGKSSYNSNALYLSVFFSLALIMLILLFLNPISTLYIYEDKIVVKDFLSRDMVCIYLNEVQRITSKKQIVTPNRNIPRNTASGQFERSSVSFYFEDDTFFELGLSRYIDSDEIKKEITKIYSERYIKE